MDSKVRSFTKNFSYTFISNLLSIIISTVLVLIIPRYIGIGDYGYWQLYIFYVSYISYMSLGLTDGSYLRYGGYEYNALPRSIFVSQFWFLVILDIIFNFLIALVYTLNSTDPNKVIVVLLTCIAGVLTVPRSLITLMLQATNKIKEYSMTVIIEKIIYFLLVILILLSGIMEFHYLILADIIGKIVSNIYAVYSGKELVFGKFERFRTTLREVWINISVGSKLLIANLASMLIIGVIRISIDNKWNVETFGKVSLTLSISNMLMSFINAIAIVLFPALRRTVQNELSNIYQKLRLAIMVPLLGMLLLYYPISEILIVWLPHYGESLKYMAILFPMCVYESKTVMLINTYLKTLRKEKVMLNINLITLILSVLVTYINVFILGNLNITILSIVILLAFRCIVAEIYLSRLLKISVSEDILLELLLTFVFISVFWCLSGIHGFFIYLLVYIFYLIRKGHQVKNLINSTFGDRKSQ